MAMPFADQTPEPEGVVPPAVAAPPVMPSTQGAYTPLPAVPGKGMPFAGQTPEPGDVSTSAVPRQPPPGYDLDQARAEQLFRGMSLGLSDPVEAAEAAIYAKLGLMNAPPGAASDSWGDYYSAARQAQRARQHQYASERPGEAAGVAFTGSLVPAYFTGGGSVPATAARSGLLSAGAGGISAATESANTPLSAAWWGDVGKGAGLSGITGAAIPKLTGLARVFQPGSGFTSNALLGAGGAYLASHVAPYLHALGPFAEYLGARELFETLKDPAKKAAGVAWNALRTPLGPVASRVAGSGAPVAWGDLLGNYLPSLPPGGTAPPYNTP